MTDPIGADRAPAIAEDAARYAGLAVESPEVVRVGRAVVIRALSDCGPIFIKRFGDDAEMHFRRERSGLLLLAGLDEAAPFVPPLLACDEASRTLVTAQISGTSFAGILDGADPLLAAQALNAAAERLGVLHARAMRSVNAFDVAGSSAESPGTNLRNAIPAAVEFCGRALGRDLDRGSVQSALETVADDVDRPGPLRTITVGDMAPSNVIRTEVGAAFVDLEYCASRHAFYDAMFWHGICVFPDTIADAMDLRYRRAFEAEGVALTDEAFGGDMLALMAQRLFWTLSWNMVDLFDADREFAPRTSSRAIVIGYLHNFLRFSGLNPGAARPPLEDLCGRLLECLAAVWAQESRPVLFPCFAGRGQ